MLIEQLQQVDMLLTILPSFLTVIALSTVDDYRNLIQAHFSQIFTMTRPMQVFNFIYKHIINETSFAVLVTTVFTFIR